MRARSTCAIAAVALLAGATQAADPPSLELPVTFDRVWYRAGKNGETGGKKRTGDLTVTTEALEFHSPKEQARLPLRSIRAVSMGRITGDVDTDWVVLAVGPAGATRLVSFRDGAKLGFGKGTLRIYRTILDTLRLAGAGPYDVPDGFEIYDALADQFTLAVPSGWTPFHQSSIDVHGRPLWGRIIFSEQPLGSAADGADELEPALRRIEAGTQSAFTLDRSEALGGMRCSGFSGSAERKLVARVEAEELLATAGEILEGPIVEPLPLGDCIGRRLRARVRDAGGAEILFDARAVSDDRTLFLLMLRTRPADRAEALARFDRIVASFQPAVAR